MQLQHLSLTTFKNIARVQLDLSAGVNCFLGDNGMGKSNLLDAIYMLSFTRSFTGVPDQMLINTDSDFAMLQGSYLRRDTPEELTLGLQRGRRKSLKRKGKEYRRMSEHIGLFPLVMVAPQDMDLIRGSGEERRRWIDLMIAQGNPRYLDALIRYGQALEQRNRLLRDGVRDTALYEALEIPMAAAADYIHRCRAERIAELRDIFARYYTAIAGTDEATGLEYSSPLLAPEASMQTLLDGARGRDMIIGHTTVGPHRDDIELTLNDMPLRRTGSQGQCKTFVIALRLAQHDFLSRATGLKPLLLLDDIFDKLDAVRVDRIMQMVGRGSFGQIFITDTNRRHLDEIVACADTDHRLWSVDHGQFSLIPSGR